MSVAVKICGINSEAGFDTAVEAGADLLGFVFFPRSPRFVTARQAAALCARHPRGPLRVGLFVDPTEDDVKSVLDIVPLDKLQLYANEHLCRRFRETFGLQIGRAIAAESKTDLPTNCDGIDCLVVEPKPPPGSTRPGGNATKLDWSITQSWRPPIPWLLAGGLTPDNVADAISLSGCPGVDVSSGVESLPGVKSPALIRRFIANAKAVRLGGRQSSSGGSAPWTPDKG